MAKNSCEDVPENPHPHLWRHSRSMHLYQNGMDLTLIAQWLGHSKLETVQIYAKADTEQKRKAMALANQNGPLATRINPERFNLSDDDLIKQLYGLM